MADPIEVQEARKALGARLASLQGDAQSRFGWSAGWWSELA